MRRMIPRLPQHTVLPYKRGRRAALDAFLSQRRHLIYGLLEVDVTAARAILRAYRHQSGESLSFTAFVIGCVARAVQEQKTIQTYRRGRRHLIVFDDVDVAMLMEREIAGELRVVLHIVRAANTKSVLQIHREVRAAQRAQATESAELAAVRLYDVLPRLVRRALIRLATHVPSLWKQCAGTVAVTAVGMVGTGGGWGIPITSHPLDVAVGGISEQPRIVDGRIAVREVLNLTISVDHDVIDGAPAARFGSRLRELLESAYGLEGLATPSAGEAAMVPS
jgi:pyruvate/2-oxoglutarate dehydrogenase complex dihydrolipoamide acyltransferase (E2) component